jgi:hypothetical protein
LRVLEEKRGIRTTERTGESRAEWAKCAARVFARAYGWAAADVAPSAHQPRSASWAFSEAASSLDEDDEVEAKPCGTFVCSRARNDMFCMTFFPLGGGGDMMRSFSRCQHYVGGRVGCGDRDDCGAQLIVCTDYVAI